MIRFSIVTIFPDVINTYIASSIIGRALKQQALSIKVYNLRDWATDKHHTVDDRVFGGGPGMLMKIEPLYKAVTRLKEIARADGFLPWVITTAASGDLFTQHTAKSWAASAISTDYIILCGHYEGFDHRINQFIDQSIGIGPYVLTGGELASLIMVDATTRLLPGVLGNTLSSEDETTFSIQDGKILIDGEHPQYTTPAQFTYSENNEEKMLVVPEILRSGHHKKIQTENCSRRTKKTIDIA